MPFELFILDFDGTFTDVEREAGPFIESYKREVRELLADDDIEASWDRAIAQIQSAPEVYGWTYDGHVVAPGNADPYLRATVAMNMLFDERGLFPDHAERTSVLQRLYHRNYPKADTCFRPEAKEVVEALIDSGVPTFVVTNSATDAVTTKLDRLSPVGQDRLTVHGDARKYVVCEPEESDPRFDAVPAETRCDGLERPVMLRRGHYYTTLRRIWSETGARPETTLIIGDIYELDLALPSTLGVHTHLVLGRNTPPFERRAVEASPRGAVSDDLRAVLARAGLA